MTTRLTEPRFVRDETGTKVAVVLPIDVYEELVEQLEQQDDLKAIEEAMKDSERIPWEQVKMELYSRSPSAVCLPLAFARSTHRATSI